MDLRIPTRTVTNAVVVPSFPKKSENKNKQKKTNQTSSHQHPSTANAIESAIHKHATISHKRRVPGVAIRVRETRVVEILRGSVGSWAEWEAGEGLGSRGASRGF